MNKTIKRSFTALLTLAVLLSLFVPMLPASAAGKACTTKYPIIFVHGAGLQDETLGFINYWGRIPEALEAEGAKVFYGGTDGWGSIESNAKKLRDTINKVLSGTGAKKVNLIAHSKGGIEARYMISSLGMSGKVASLTMVSTPNRGSELLGDLYDLLPNFAFRAISPVVNASSRVGGDKDPDFYTGVQSLTPDYMKAFNKKNPDKKGVYYQSYAAAVKGASSDLLMSFTTRAVRSREGENDGLVSVASAKWGNFRGVLRGARTQGISHADVCDLRRRDIAMQPIHGAANIREFYVAVAKDLKARGY